MYNMLLQYCCYYFGRKLPLKILFETIVIGKYELIAINFNIGQNLFVKPRGHIITNTKVSEERIISSKIKTIATNL